MSRGHRPAIEALLLAVVIGTIGAVALNAILAVCFGD